MAVSLEKLNPNPKNLSLTMTLITKVVIEKFISGRRFYWNSFFVGLFCQHPMVNKNVSAVFPSSNTYPVSGCCWLICLVIIVISL